MYFRSLEGCFVWQIIHDVAHWLQLGKDAVVGAKLESITTVSSVNEYPFVSFCIVSVVWALEYADVNLCEQGQPTEIVHISSQVRFMQIQLYG